MANERVEVHNHTSGGIGLGVIGAVLLSWTTWHSVPWALLHALCGWIYVVYWLCVHW